METRSKKSGPEGAAWGEDAFDNLFESLFCFTYTLCLTPYGVQYDATKGRKFNVTSSRLKWYTSLLLTLLESVIAMVWASNAFAQADLRTPAIIFYIAPEVGDAFLCFTFWYVSWFRRAQVSTLFALMSTPSFPCWRCQKSKLHFKNHKLRGSMTLVILMISIIVSFDFGRLIGDIIEASGGAPLGLLFEALRRGFFGGEVRPLKKTEDMSALEIGLATLVFFLAFLLKVYKALAILVCIVAVVVGYKGSAEFKDYFEAERDQLKIIQAFRSFQDWIEAINGITGPLIFTIAIVCAPTFFVANMTRVLVSWTHDSPMIWLTMTVYSFVLLVGSEITTKTDEYREWILKRGEGPYEHHLFGVFIELTQNPVGLRGLDCFTLTHGFLAQVSSAVVTFTIILLQFQSE